MDTNPSYGSPKRYPNFGTPSCQVVLEDSVRQMLEAPLGFDLIWVDVRDPNGLYGDNGKENRNYCSLIGYILGYRPYTSIKTLLDNSSFQV